MFNLLLFSLSGKHFHLFFMSGSHLYISFSNFSINVNFLSNSLRFLLFLLYCFLVWGYILAVILIKQLSNLYVDWMIILSFALLVLLDI